MTTAEQKYAAFELLARNYCTTLTRAAKENPFYLIAVQDCLLELYLAATRLPPIVLVAKNKKMLPADQLVSQAEWHALYQQLGEKLPFDCYWDIFDPIDADDKEPVCSTLADDLADIWRDMTDGLRLLETQGAAATQDVWWEWRFGFYTHWGEHATGALRAIYHFLRREG